MKRRDFFRAAGIGVASLGIIGRRSVAGTVIRVPDDFGSIQSAVDAASPGDMIQVAPGTYFENVLITKSDLRITAPVAAGADRTVLHGSGSGSAFFMDGTASPVRGIQIMGFVAENYASGIRTINAELCKFHLNEVRQTSGIAIRIANSQFNDISQNFVHDCFEGIILGTSFGNTVRGNRCQDLGQNPDNPGACGVFTNSVATSLTGANDNVIVENEILRSYWGVLITGAKPGTGNRVAQNRCHECLRAGVAVLEPHHDNFILQNNCTGNGLANLAPSGTSDLFDDLPVNNIWGRNQGTSNF